jgi:hypothetical protein
MRRLLLALTVILAAQSSVSADDFLHRGHNPGHIFGNTVRRAYWGANYASKTSSRSYYRSR